MDTKSKNKIQKKKNQEQKVKKFKILINLTKCMKIADIQQAHQKKVRGARHLFVD